MDTRRLQFISGVVGVDGASALAKATSQSADLEWAIFPRVVMAWLEVVSQGEFNDHLPGVAETKLVLKKGESDKFSGSINIGEETYWFSDVSLYHVAGAVAVALGGDSDRVPELRSSALAKLGKSIDLLVRARTLRKVQARQNGGGAKGAGLPGVAAAPKAPQGPQPPVEKQPQNSIPGAAAGTKPTAKLPVSKPTAKKPTLKVVKSAAKMTCVACGDQQFRNDRYVGCLCFRDLAKSVKTTITHEGYILEFGSNWDADALACVAENLGK
jgi:hypothetical protein